MPYIDQAKRKRLIAYGDTDPQDAGELTFVIQQALNTYLAVNGLSYRELAECLGALEGAKIDLTERVIKPYEEEKRFQNGDVWTVHVGRRATVGERPA